MGRVSILATFFLAMVMAGPAGADAPGGDYPPLRESFDPRLQRGLEAALVDLRLADAVAGRKLAVALVDITDPHEPRVASINGDEMMYAASLPKIAILLGAFVEVEAGTLELDGATRESLTAMIRTSSNVEATRVLNRVGRTRLLDILQSEPYRLYDPLVNGGLWVGKEYAKSPAYQRDPLHNLSHGATVMQTARFYYLLETGQLVNAELSAQMKSLLGEPAIRHKFVKGLESRPGARIYRKSGTWRQWHADSALVEDGGYKYIAVALAADERGGTWLTRLIGRLHDLVVPARVVRAD
ncbi:MAG: serine hydrolase [Gammaproteobacteria bacterium]|nr:serine hydrolase [Gammaproteobacteria bacterium]